ncbi:hypothetical protein ACO0LM_13940 [Undibacterium sp. Di26W]|uniref:hypothetical protein n=1 Tax=Undibacterium sp. Di26W TaxID=3413035 RepID=UPI003BF38124
MTMQQPDQLISRYKESNFDGYYLYSVITGDPQTNYGWGEEYKFLSVPKIGPEIMSSLWRGHLSHYLLDECGEIFLRGFEYPLPRIPFCDISNEKLTGDFYLVFKKNFYEDRIYVPFKNGKLIADVSHWIRENTGRTKNSWLQKIDEQFFDENSCMVLIDFGATASELIRNYAVYVDGNISGTHKKDSAPANNLLIRVKSGSHRIVVRERDHNKKARAESEILIFSATEAQPNRFCFRVEDKHLILIEE